jgi:hypothetical protein
VSWQNWIYYGLWIALDPYFFAHAWFKPFDNLKDLNASKNNFEAKIIEIKSGIPSLES